MDIMLVSFVVAPFRMVHCVNPEYVFVHCPLTLTASMLTKTTATYECILWIPMVDVVLFSFEQPEAD